MARLSTEQTAINAALAKIKRLRDKRDLLDAEIEQASQWVARQTENMQMPKQPGGNVEQ